MGPGGGILIGTRKDLFLAFAQRYAEEQQDVEYSANLDNHWHCILGFRHSKILSQLNYTQILTPVTRKVNLQTLSFYPAWEQIEADIKLCRRDLVEQPGVLKNLVWQSINKCQQESQELAGFERIQSRNLVEIEIKEFEKTSTGKIKRGNYIEVVRVRR